MVYRFSLFEELDLRQPGLQKILFVLLLVLLAILILYNGVLIHRLERKQRLILRHKRLQSEWNSNGLKNFSLHDVEQQKRLLAEKQKELPALVPSGVDTSLLREWLLDAVAFSGLELQRKQVLVLRLIFLIFQNESKEWIHMMLMKRDLTL